MHCPFHNSSPLIPNPSQMNHIHARAVTVSNIVSDVKTIRNPAQPSRYAVVYYVARCTEFQQDKKHTYNVTFGSSGICASLTLLRRSHHLTRCVLVIVYNSAHVTECDYYYQSVITLHCSNYYLYLNTDFVKLIGHI
jgi:hypothetical protein